MGPFAIEATGLLILRPQRAISMAPGCPLRLPRGMMCAMSTARSPRPMRLALLALALFSACGGDDPASGQTVAGVQHLDPHLETSSGPVPAAPALFALREVVHEWAFEPSGWPAEWQLENGRVGDAPLWGGQVAVPLDLQGDLLRLGLERSFDTRSFNVVEVEVVRRKDVHATLRWGRASSEKQFLAIGHRRTDEQITTIRFELDGNSAWSDTIEDLTLTPSSGWNQPVELLSVRFVNEPFSYGGDPLSTAIAAGGEDVALDTLSGDGGLIERAGLAVRAWPARVDDVLATTVEVPADGLLAFEYARGPNANQVPLRLTARAGMGDEWISKTLELEVEGNSWRHASLDLESLAGETARIEFAVELAGTGDSSALPSRTDVLVGAPMVLGRLHADRRPNVILVTSDTTRYDVFGAYLDVAAQGGTEPWAERVHTPFLDELAADAIVFEDAWSQSNSTQPSHASILTGLSVQDHSLFDNYGILGAGAETLAESLRAAGYQTAAVTCQAAIATRAGFGQGFDLFLPPDEEALIDGRDAIDQAREWIESWSAERDRPFFLWVHVFDPHTPYVLPEGELAPFTAETGAAPDPANGTRKLPAVAELPPEMAFLEGVENHAYATFLYHAEVAYTDRLLADLFGSVRAAGLVDDTIEIVTADHGESLGERGNYFNHRGLYPETVRVPLLMRVPGMGAGARVQARVTNRDVAPTVRALLGLGDVPRGQDLTAALEDPAAAPERVWFEHANGYVIGSRDDTYHFMVVLRDNFTFGLTPVEGSPYLMPVPQPKGKVELYDWRADPGLTRNLADERPEVVAEYLALVDEYRASAEPVGSQKRAMTAEEEAQMESLGYTGD